MIKDKILFLGFGAYGSVLANVASNNSNNVYVWDLNKERLENFNKTRLITSLFDFYRFRDNINVVSDIKEGLKKTKYIVLAVPSKNIIDAIHLLNKHLMHSVNIISIAKGFIPNTEKTVHDLIKKHLNKDIISSFSVLSGPSHAREIIKEKITGVNIASTNEDLGNDIVKLFSTKYFYVKQVPHIKELIYCGALKNAYSVGAGLVKALYNSANTSAFYLNIAYNEMKFILSALGMEKNIASELCGLGDLIATGTTKLSRNYRVGFEFGIHKSAVKVFEQSQNSTIEGIHSIKVLYQMLISKNKVTPIIEMLFTILFQGQDSKNFKKIFEK